MMNEKEKQAIFLRNLLFFFILLISTIIPIPQFNTGYFQMEDLDQVTFSNCETILGDRELDENFLSVIHKIVSKKQDTNALLFEEETYNPSQADYQLIHELANIHAQANILNSTSSKEFKEIQEDNKCRCGCNRGYGLSLPLLFNEQKISFLGSGVILFFFYLRNIKLLLLLCFFIFSVFCIITNLIFAIDVNKNEVQCSQYITKLGQQICFYNENSTFQYISGNRLIVNLHMWLGFFLGILWIFGVRLITKLGLIKENQIDMSLKSASDYTLKIENLPFGEYNEYDILDYLHEVSIDQPWPLEISGVQTIYNMDECRGLIEVIQQISVQLVSMLENKENDGFERIKVGCCQKYIERKRQFVGQLIKLRQLREQFKNNGNFRMKNATTLALAEFPSHEQLNKFLKVIKVFQNPLQETLLPDKSFLFKGKRLVIKRAPQPSDIIWRNCERNVSAFRFIMIWLAVFLVLYVGYAAISFAQTSKYMKQEKGVVASAIIQLFNRLIWLILSFLVAYEHNNTKTQAIISLMKKSILAQSINIIVTPMISKYVNMKPLYGDLGVSGMALSYQFVMMIMMIFYYILNPLHIGKYLLLKITPIRNYIIRKNCKRALTKEDNSNQMDLSDVFAIYEGPQFPIAGAYVYMTTATFHGLFYCHLQPIILLFVVFNMTFFTIILKYMLYRRCKIPELTDVQVFQFAMFMISWGSLFYAVGSIFFLINDDNIDLKTNFQYVIPSILLIIIWFLSTLNALDFCPSFDNKLLDLIKRAHHTGKIVNRKTFRGTIHEKMSQVSNNEDINIWERKQSYYKDCNTNILLEFEKELLEYSSNYPKKGYHLKKFTQSFNTIETYSCNPMKGQKSQNLDTLNSKLQNIYEESTNFFKLKDQHEKSKKFSLIPVISVQNQQIQNEKKALTGGEKAKRRKF